MPLIYTKHMTPKWLTNRRNEDVIEWFVDDVINRDTVVEIPADNSDFEKIAAIELIDSNITTASETLIFKIRASLEHNSPIIEPSRPQPRVRDPLSIMISDGEQAVGIQIQDPEDYHTIGPYIGIEGKSGNILTNITRYESQTKPVDLIPTTERRRWPQVFEITIKTSSVRRFSECSVSCSSAVRGGTSVSADFSNPLNPRGPWRLELYRGEREETYNINFLDVSIFVEDRFIVQRTW